MTFDPFLNAECQLGNGWWIVIFFVVLASILGQINVCWLMELCLGGLTGCVLMVIHALILGIFGWVSFHELHYVEAANSESTDRQAGFFRKKSEVSDS